MSNDALEIWKQPQFAPDALSFTQHDRKYRTASHGSLDSILKAECFFYNPLRLVVT